MDNLPLRVGDALLVRATARGIERFNNNRNFIVAQGIERHDYRESKIPVAVGIVTGVIALAALGFLPIVVATSLGALVVAAMKCLRPTELHDAVQWDVILLLAGVIPLDIAMESSGAAGLLAELAVMIGDYLPFVAVPGVFYSVTTLLTNVISNNASVALTVPVAIETVAALGVGSFSFVLTVMLATSTVFMTPVSYQTNLFIYGPGSYKFTDYIRVDGPLQLLLDVVTIVGVAYLFPLI